MSIFLIQNKIQDELLQIMQLIYATLWAEEMEDKSSTGEKLASNSNFWLL